MGKERAGSTLAVPTGVSLDPDGRASGRRAVLHTDHGGSDSRTDHYEELLF